MLNKARSSNFSKRHEAPGPTSVRSRGFVPLLSIHFCLRERLKLDLRYVTPGDIEALREAMNELQEAPSSVRDVAARQMHAATFDWGRSARESIKVYETVVGRCPTRI